MSDDDQVTTGGDSTTALASPDTSDTGADSGGGALQAALGSDSGLASLAGVGSANISQPPQPAPNNQPAQPQQEPLRGLGGRLRGVLLGLASGGVVGGIEGAIAPNVARTHFQQNEAVRAARTSQATSAAQSAAQNIQFESVRAADTHIAASKQADRIDQMNEEGRIEIAQKNAEYQAYMLNTFGISPDLNISGVGDDVHAQANGALNTLAGENNGQIPPVHTVVQPHTPNDPNFKIGVYAPNQQDFKKNPQGFRNLVDTQRAVQGLLPIDDLTWNSGGGKGYQGQRMMAQEAMQFLSPVQPFTKENLPAVLAQRKQLLAAYQGHTDMNGKLDADPSTVQALRQSVSFLQNAQDDMNAATNKQAADEETAKENARAATPTGRLDTAEKLASIAEKKANIREKEDQDVVAYDPTYQNSDGSSGGNVVMSRGDAEQRNLTHYKIDASLVNANVAGMNDVQTKLNSLADVVNDTRRMSQVDPKLAAAMLNPTTGVNLSFGGHGGGASAGIGIATDRINAWLNNANVREANQPTRDYVAAFLGAHEAITQLPRLQTFGKSSRMNQVQMEAALNLLPQPGDTPSFSQQKMQGLQTMIDPLRKQMPHMPGSELIPSWMEKQQNAKPINIPGYGNLYQTLGAR